MNASLSPIARIRTIVSGSIGNLVEWYDWYAYAVFSLYFAPVFFPSKDPTVQLMQSAAVFALGFLVRPLGGWLLGSLADRRGRKFAMTFSVLLMSFGSLCIAILPGYDTWGYWAPSLLLMARLLQGLSVGGEYGTSATYLSEVAEPSRRGFYSSFQYVTLVGGQLLALLVQLLLQALYSAEELQAWAWRLPFVLGALFAFLAFYLRAHMQESHWYEQSSQQKKGQLREMFRYSKSTWYVLGLTAGGTLSFYTFTTYMQKFLVNSLHLPKTSATQLSFWTLLIFALLQPLYGHLSDRWGRRNMLLAFAWLGALGFMPIVYVLQSLQNVWAIFACMMLALLVLSAYTSINAVVKAELFPTQVRALGVGFPYAIAVALFGGSAEYIALWFKNQGMEMGYFVYTTTIVLLTLFSVWHMPDTKETGYLKEE